MMLQLLKLVSLICAVTALPMVEKGDSAPTFVLHDRLSWGAAPSTDNRRLHTPVPYAVLHHTYIPAACNTSQECGSSMRAMQRYHMSQGWGDIGYNFCVGSDGAAYEGRGWSHVGIHAGKVNGLSIGICLIGDWRFELPPPQQLATARALIAAGVEAGVISPNYQLIGHRQAMPTECPGTALFNEISTWDHFAAVDLKGAKSNKVA